MSGQGGSVKPALNGHAPAISVSAMVSGVGLVVAVFALPWATAKDVDRVEHRLAQHSSERSHSGSAAELAELKARQEATERAQAQLHSDVRELRAEVKDGFRDVIRRLGGEK